MNKHQYREMGKITGKSCRVNENMVKGELLDMAGTNAQNVISNGYWD